MTNYKLKAVAVVRKNSLSFIENIFTFNQARQPVVVIGDVADADNLGGIEVERCIVPDGQTGWYTARHDLIFDDLPAQVTYTSGTEGLPKGIVLTYANLADAATRIIDEMRMTSEVREYVGVPATFSFGMARYRAISAVGGHAYMPPRGFDPLELSRMLASKQVNALSAVPTLLRILLDTPGIIGDEGKNLRWMEIGSQYMTADEKLRIRAMFPNARIVQHYGLTEASRSTFLQISDATEDMLSSVGRPVGHTEIQLGADHRIRIRGPHVARSRVDADGLHDLQDADGWLQTNDLGHMRDGFLFFDGRADDLINCGGVKISPDQLEEKIRPVLPPQTLVVVAKVPDAQRGEGILVAVKGSPEAVVKASEVAASALQKMGVVAGSALHVMAVDEIPTTGTGKVQRLVLSERFLAQKASDRSEAKLRKGEISDVLSLFQYEFVGKTIRLDDTFETLGGDSLLYIQFTLGYEQRFGALPDQWEKLTVAELQNHAAKQKKTGWLRLETATLTRAFFMICIVALHTDAFVYSPNWGAAYFLMLLAGYSVARFQLPEIIRSGSVRTLWGTIQHVAVPTILMVAFLQVATKRFEILPLLLVSNYVDPHDLKGYLLYFAEFYIQLLVIAALVFSIPKVRESFRTQPMFSAIALMIAMAVVNLIIEHFWSFEYNYHRTPWNYGWDFALGMVLALAKDPKSRLLALGVALIAISFKWGMTSAAYYVAGGSVLVLFVQSITTPAPVKMIVSEIAGASLFIYLNHYVMISFVRKIFHKEMPWLTLIASVVAGVIMAHAYAWGSRKVILIFERFRDRRRAATA